MRIALVSRVYPTHRPGGMPHVVEDRALALAAAGHEVHVITTGISESVDAKRVRTASVETNPSVHHTNSTPQEWSGPFADQAESLVRRLRPQILHFDSIDKKRPWWNERPGGVKRVGVTLHGFGWGAWLTKWNLFRSRTSNAALPSFPISDIAEEIGVLGRADVVLGVSRWERRMLRDHYGLRSAELVYNPISAAFFEPRRAPVVRDRFLCVAVSQGETRGFGAARLAANQAGVRLEIAGDVPREAMPELYDRARAVVLPTAFAQGYDLSIAEARARGCPAILGATGSYLDEAREEWDILVEPHDMEQLAQVLSNHQPKPVPAGAADAHRPDEHARRWLEAMAG